MKWYTWSLLELYLKSSFFNYHNLLKIDLIEIMHRCFLGIMVRPFIFFNSNSQKSSFDLLPSVDCQTFFVTYSVIDILHQILSNFDSLIPKGVRGLFKPTRQFFTEIEVHDTKNSFTLGCGIKWPNIDSLRASKFKIYGLIKRISYKH